MYRFVGVAGSLASMGSCVKAECLGVAKTRAWSSVSVDGSLRSSPHSLGTFEGTQQRRRLRGAQRIAWYADWLSASWMNWCVWRSPWPRRPHTAKVWRPRRSMRCRNLRDDVDGRGGHGGSASTPPTHTQNSASSRHRGGSGGAPPPVDEASAALGVALRFWVFCAGGSAPTTAFAPPPGAVVVVVVVVVADAASPCAVACVLRAPSGAAS
mmetsp:Transcript_16035/g.64721  ORF Transcript_16035/g.64721 Transcript_16035/m.64721 type:complete len:211 (+) Transcript_16035:1781-2413(+)